MERASGFSSRIAFTAGPRLSISSMRAAYFSTSDRAVYLPDFIPSWSSGMVISSSSNGLTSAGWRPGTGTFGGGAETSRAAAPAAYMGARAPAVVPSTAVWRNVRRVGLDFGLGLVGMVRAFPEWHDSSRKGRASFNHERSEEHTPAEWL